MGSLCLLLALTSMVTAQDTLYFDNVVFDAFGIDLPAASAGHFYHVAPVDLDLDGDLDAVVSERMATSLPSFEPVAVTYYQNNSLDPCEPQYDLVFGNPYNFDQNSIVQPVFVDIDADGDLDIFSANYIDFSYSIPPTEFHGRTNYGGPLLYPKLPDNLFLNLGNGEFQDISLDSGIGRLAEWGMGSICFDYDDDGDHCSFALHRDA